jgi:hypothetical protein
VVSPSAEIVVTTAQALLSRKDAMSIETIFTPQDDAFYSVKTHAAGPQGALPLTPQMLMESPSGNLFGMTQNAGMGWDANKLTGKEVLWAVKTTCCGAAAKATKRC